MKRFKNFFVEEVPQEDALLGERAEAIFFDEEAFRDDVNTENVSNENLIEDLYVANGLEDKTNSIFKVEELINSLPKEMPNDTKRATVLSILGSFNLSLEEIANDADRRSDIVSSAASHMIEGYISACDMAYESIEAKKKEIETLEKEIATAQEQSKRTAELSSTEIARITNLVEFMMGAK